MVYKAVTNIHVQVFCELAFLSGKYSGAALLAHRVNLSNSMKILPNSDVCLFDCV